MFVFELECRQLSAPTLGFVSIHSCCARLRCCVPGITAVLSPSGAGQYFTEFSRAAPAPSVVPWFSPTIQPRKAIQVSQCLVCFRFGLIPSQCKVYVVLQLSCANYNMLSLYYLYYGAHHWLVTVVSPCMPLEHVEVGSVAHSLVSWSCERFVLSALVQAKATGRVRYGRTLKAGKQPVNAQSRERTSFVVGQGHHPSPPTTKPHTART